VCGQSGSGKTYFCLKLVSLALLEKNVAVIYIDTSNYVNSDNMTLVLKVSLAAKLTFSRTLSLRTTRLRRLKLLKKY
jgi:type II secretory pathway predicted ATPase ExeA